MNYLVKYDSVDKDDVYTQIADFKNKDLTASLKRTVTKDQVTISFTTSSTDNVTWVSFKQEDFSNKISWVSGISNKKEMGNKKPPEN